MLTKTAPNGQRICKIDNDIIEIENNLNLEILRLKKIEEMKSEKRVDIVIKEAAEDLESGTKVWEFEDSGEEEKGKISEEGTSLVKARSGTEYIQIHEEFRETHQRKDGTIKKSKVPYVRKKTFLRAKAQYALPSRQIASETLTELNNPVTDYKFAITMDGPSFLPVKNKPEEYGVLGRKITEMEISNSLDQSRDSYVGEINEEYEPHKNARSVPIKISQLPKIERILLDNRNLFSNSILA